MFFSVLFNWDNYMKISLNFKYFCDPLEIFHDPLPGRDPSVEKCWSMGFRSKYVSLTESG
jgi:hypothetical protein